ncbi:MAG TPA: hypothetical protein VF690_14890, partial [Hymenobacter sp.]
MTTPSWAWPDFGIGLALVALFGIVMFATGIWFLVDLRRLMRNNAMISSQTIFVSLFTIPVACIVIWIAYSSANKQRLLRGECHYTVARVYENRRIKGDEISRF